MKGRRWAQLAAGAGSVLLLSLLPGFSYAGSDKTQTWQSFCTDSPDTHYTFITIVNPAGNNENVTVTFFKNDGDQVASESFLLPGRHQLQLNTESGGGPGAIAGTAGLTGYLQIESTQSDLQLWGAVVFPNDRYAGYSLTFSGL